MKKFKTKLIIITASVLLIFALASFALSNYFNYIELKEIGINFTKVFWTDFSVNLITQGTSFALFFLLIFLNFLIIRANLTAIDESFNYLKRVLPLMLISAVISAYYCGISRAAVADKFLPYINSEWFSLGDPVFNADIGYYVFQRPFYEALSSVFSGMVLIIILLTVLSYISMYARFDFYNFKKIFKEKPVITHTMITAVTFLVVKAI